MELIPLSKENISLYIELATKSYYQHYLHLWKDADPIEYIRDNLSVEVVERDLENTNLEHFIITEEGEEAGIIKVVRNSAIMEYKADEALLIEKIYLLEEFSGKGIGKACLQYFKEYAISIGKKAIWLDTMKNGRPLPFYRAFGFEIVGEKQLSYPSVLEEQRPMVLLCLSL